MKKITFLMCKCGRDLSLRNIRIGIWTVINCDIFTIIFTSCAFRFVFFFWSNLSQQMWLRFDVLVKSWTNIIEIDFDSQNCLQSFNFQLRFAWLPCLGYGRKHKKSHIKVFMGTFLYQATLSNFNCFIQFRVPISRKWMKTQNWR